MAQLKSKSKNINKEVKYVNRDFGELRRELINFTRNYFPETYNDFNEASPGMMFIELASMVGDVLSFYTDVQLRESLLVSAEEELNLYNIAHSLGYKPKYVTPSSVDLDIFQLLPSTVSGSQTVPDFRYALQIQEGATFFSDSQRQFRSLDAVDFSSSSSLDPTELSIFSLDTSGEVDRFLLKKKVRASSGTIVQRTYNFTTPRPYDKIVLPEENVLEIVSITDSDGNKWYETPYLAQDLVPIATPNLPYNDAFLARYRSSAPFLLQFKQTERRFVSRLRENNLTEIQFGAGVSSELDEEIIPNPLNVGFGLDYFERAVDLSIDPKNFLYTKTYGKAPSNTTLTVRYTVGGGIEDNVLANSITTINSINITTPQANLDSSLFNSIKDSVAVNNSEPARGGLSRRNIESVRRDALANFAAQNRAVTKEDYIVRAYSMPAKFGSIAKAFVEQDDQLAFEADLNSRMLNQFALNLYTLGYDDNKNFTELNDAVKFNLLNYMKQYRMLTDSVNIKTAYIINIGVDFEIIVNETYNSNEVLLKCIDTVKSFFDNEKMEIGKPIFKNTLLTDISLVEGVISVAFLDIYNLCDESKGYSGNAYNIEAATRKNIIYTSLDPSIFEVKYPNKDIRGKVTNY
jgi:hypothetical protein